MSIILIIFYFRNELFMKESLPPYDWTYTSSYNGTILSDHIIRSCTISSSDVSSDDGDSFDKSLLMKKDPILFLSSLSLYEDEMGDNGTSIYSVKIRVMPDCFLLLARSFVKIDQTILRSRETRIMSYISNKYEHMNSSPITLYRECCAKELRWVSDASVFNQLVRIFFI